LLAISLFSWPNNFSELSRALFCACEPHAVKGVNAAIWPIFPYATKGTIFPDLYGGGSMFQKLLACFWVTDL
jgi:hypothetical protein